MTNKLNDREMKPHTKIFSSSLAACLLFQYIDTDCIACNTPITVNLTCLCPESPTVLKLPIKEEHEDYFFMDGSVKAVPVKLFSHSKILQL